MATMSCGLLINTFSVFLLTQVISVNGIVKSTSISDTAYIINILSIYPGQYVLGTGTYSFADAQSYCEGLGLALASIETFDDWNAARFACGGNVCWIGLQDDLNGNDDGLWHWTDGTDLSAGPSYGFNSDRTATYGVAPWNTGEPNEWRGTEEDCVEMYGSGKYNDNLCTKANRPLCNPGMTSCCTFNL